MLTGVMGIFEPYQPRRASADMSAPYEDLQIRLAVPDDVRQLCAIEAERIGGGPADLLSLIE